ncbi:MAG: hypothetical protein H7061_01895 [Bdellovibrionaceae bacterium]|nr:hypothetical protein [Bdellovibrio sp.]
MIGVDAIAAANQPDRRAYVAAAYEGFLGALNFLAGSDPFLAKLSADEKIVFQTLGDAIVKRTIRLAPPAQVGENRTSLHLSNKLFFSDKNEDFIIPPDKKVRTAKMDGDIWFNLNVINELDSTFSLLEAFQIMYHEFGHKLGGQVPTVVVDSIGAKMRTYLAGYYKESLIAPGLTAKTLVLPYLMIYGQPIDYQMEPIVIFDVNGKALNARLNTPRMAVLSGQYSEANQLTQAYARMDLTPQFKQNDGFIVIEWFTEIKHFLIKATRFNYIDLYTRVDQAKPLMAMEPLVVNKSIIQRLKVETLNESLPLAGQPLISLDLKDYLDNYQNYKSSFADIWVEKLKVTETKNGRTYFEGVIKSPTVPKEAVFKAQHHLDYLQIPGTIETLTQGYHKVQGSVAEVMMTDKDFIISGIALDNTTEFPLPEKIIIKPKANNIISPKLNNIRVWDGLQWQSVRQITNPNVVTDDVKLRFEMSGATGLLNHIEISWMVQEGIQFNGTTYGYRSLIIPEVFSTEKMKQTLKEGLLVVEISSQKMNQYLPPENGFNGFTTEDGGHHSILRIQLVDANMEAMNIPGRMTNSGWKSIFTLKKPNPGLMKSCHQLFAH